MLYTGAYSSIVIALQSFFDRAQDGDILNRRWSEVDDGDHLWAKAYWCATAYMCRVFSRSRQTILVAFRRFENATYTTGDGACDKRLQDYVMLTKLRHDVIPVDVNATRALALCMGGRLCD